MNAATNFQELREDEYLQRLKVNRLRREVYEQPDPAASGDLLNELQAAEEALGKLEQKRAKAQGEIAGSNGLIVNTEVPTSLLGAETTGIEAKIHLHMAQVPTSICHLLTAEQTPLVKCEVRNAKNDGVTRRIRVKSFIEGYSAEAVDTIELRPTLTHTFVQLPTLFPVQVRGVTELTRATLNVMVEDMDNKLELHKTQPIWLLARTTAPLAVMDPANGEWKDLTRYLGAFVTPNEPSIMKFLRIAASLHPDGKLVGYQGNKEGVTPQVRAIFDALKTRADITYVNSVISFSPEDGSANQRVRLPREGLEDKQANCIDGTVLFASLLEGLSLSPAIVIVPGHAFVAWETWTKSNDWKYLETTMIGSHSFEEACASGEQMASQYKTLAQNLNNASKFRLWPLRTLRAEGITPME